MLYTLYTKVTGVFKHLQSFSLLVARLTLAYGFYTPAMSKWKDIDSVAEWFGTLGIPLPILNAYMAAATETIGVLLLTLGLFTRIISLPLIIIMIVAIQTVHLVNGFSAGNNGFEIPFYYMVFLLILVAFGAGKFSLDQLLFKDQK